MVIQEEDFSTHTFNRSLLSEIDDKPVLELLEDTMERLAADNSIPENSKQALLQRLKMRVAFLTTVLAVDERVAPIIKSAWQVLSNTLPSIRDTREFGKPVPDSFSVKLQRKLASTVPPRPIVETSFEDAYNHLVRLCHDGDLAAEILDYKDSHSLMVSPRKVVQTLAYRSRPLLPCSKLENHSQPSTYEPPCKDTSLEI